MTVCFILFAGEQYYISRYVWNVISVGPTMRFKESGHCYRIILTESKSQSVSNRQRSGLHTVTTVVQDRYIRVRHLRNWTSSATTTATKIPGLRRISYQTVLNRLRETGISPRKPVRRNVLTPRHLPESLRVEWMHAMWIDLFSHESRFLLSRADGRTGVYRHWGERCPPKCMQQVDRFLWWQCLGRNLSWW